MNPQDELVELGLKPEVAKIFCDKHDLGPVSDDYEMPFGKHGGVPIGQVPTDYLDWLADQEWIGKWTKVKRYIDQNKNQLQEDDNENTPF